MTAVLYISADERAGECCARENKTKQNKNLKNFGEESSLFLRDVIYSNPWQELPQECFRLCLEGQWMGREVAEECQWQSDLIYNHALDLPNPISLGCDYTVIGLRVNEQRTPYNWKPEGQELGRD